MGQVLHFRFPEGQLTNPEKTARTGAFEELGHELYMYKLADFLDLLKTENASRLRQLVAIVVELGPDIAAIPSLNTIRTTGSDHIAGVPIFACSTEENLCANAGKIAGVRVERLISGSEADEIALAVGAYEETIKAAPRAAGTAPTRRPAVTAHQLTA